jgi:hypothetical protein
MNLRIIISSVALILAIGCQTEQIEPTSADGPHDLNALLDGKADNYVSTNAREFILSGEAHFPLPQGFGEMDVESQAESLDKLAQRRISAASRSIKLHIDDRLRELNGDLKGDDVKYFVYVRRNESEAESVSVSSDDRGKVTFEIEFVGSVVLMSKIAPTRTFDVEVKDWSETEGETVTVKMRGSSSRDAFPKYNELFEDGIYDLAVHFGGDYNTERHDIDTAKWMVETLLEGDWSHPVVETFDDLKIDSAPFTRQLTVEGKPIEARVYIYHSDMVDPSEEHRLTAVMELSLAERDVVLYSGHAGPNAGFILDYQPRHEIRASDFAALPLAKKYQIYILDGCQTYRTYVDDLMANEAKTFDNVDIVTTVNTTPFSVGYQVIHQFLHWLTISGDDGQHFPLSWKTILRGFNTESFKSVHYGVHGVDNNPKLNPHASEGIACRPCQTDADCGAGGNFCLGYADGGACGVACTTDSACGEGMRCARLWDDPDLFYLPKQCVARDMVCGN